MVKEYANGNDFYEENRDVLLSDKYSEPFFRFDSPLLTMTGKDQYALKVSEGGSILLALLIDPYNILLSGDDSLAEELVGYLTSNGYRIKDYQCSLELGEKLVMSLKEMWDVRCRSSLCHVLLHPIVFINKIPQRAIHCKSL